MAYFAIAFIAPNYRDYKNQWLKAYEPGTTTPKSMALDSAASVTVAKLQLNADGFLKSAGDALVIPYIEGSYDLWLFPTSAEADANDTSSAIRVADDINSTNLSLINDLSQAYEFPTVAAYKASTIVFPLGKVIATLEFYAGTGGGASYTIIASGTENGFNVIKNTTLSQSIDLTITADTTSEQFGMRWDGVTDDADAYESASNTMGALKLQLNHPSKDCIIGRDVTITGGINQKGRGGWSISQSGTVFRHGAFTINVIASVPEFHYIIWVGASETSGTNVHCETSDPENNQNVDAKFIKCLFFSAYYSVSMVGRGITFEECAFSLFRRSLKVDWPNPFTPPSALLEQSLEFGMRGYNFFDCQWHASPGYIIENTGYNKDNFRGVVITGYPDTELSIIDGSINDFLVDLNVLYGSQALFKLGATHKAFNGVVKGTYSGKRDPANKNTGFDSILFMTDTSELDDVEFDMVCRDVKSDTFVLDGTVGNIQIKGMYADINKQNAPGIATSTRFFINNRGATINGKVRFEGTVNLEDFDDNSPYLTTGFNDSNFEQGHVSIPSYIKLFSGNCRGRFGSISRHSYTGDGTVNRQFALPAVAQYAMVCGAQPNANQGKAGIAFETSFGGTGDVVMTDNVTLQVTDDFNTNGDVYLYTVHY